MDRIGLTFPDEIFESNDLRAELREMVDYFDGTIDSGSDFGDKIANFLQ